jgi:hypothetical protein
MKKPFTTITVVILAVVALLHALRFSLAGVSSLREPMSQVG